MHNHMHVGEWRLTMKTLRLVAICVLFSSGTPVKAADLWESNMNPEDQVLICDDADDARRIWRGQLPEGEFDCRQVTAKELDGPPVYQQWIPQGAIVFGVNPSPKFEATVLWIVRVDGQELWGVWPFAKTESPTMKEAVPEPVQSMPSLLTDGETAIT